MLHCGKYKRFLSAYLDECLSSQQHATVTRHLRECRDCREELDQWRGVGALLKQLPAPPVPAELPFRIRWQLSREKQLRQRPSWRWRWANRMAPFALPAAVGLLSALLIFAALIHVFAVPVAANADDVPLNFRTSPRLRSSAPFEFNSGLEGLVVEVLIDPDGRVADYQIVAGLPDEKDLRDLQNHLLFTVFDPATWFGKPIAGRIIFSFRHLQVKG